MIFFQVMLPANNDEIVLSSACENTDFSTFKEHLKFNFIPSKKMFLAQMFRCFRLQVENYKCVRN